MPNPVGTPVLTPAEVEQEKRANLVRLFGEMDFANLSTHTLLEMFRVLEDQKNISKLVSEMRDGIYS